MSNLDGTPLKSRQFKLCVTHHHACECREEQFAALGYENEDLRIQLADLTHAYVSNYSCSEDMKELQSAVTKVLSRILVAEKLLSNLTAADLCGENTWAMESIEQCLKEFWEVE